MSGSGSDVVLAWYVFCSTMEWHDGFAHVLWISPVKFYGSLRSLNRRCRGCLPAFYPGFGLMIRCLMQLVAAARCAVALERSAELSVRCSLGCVQVLASLHGCTDVFRALALEYEIVEQIAVASVSYSCRCDAVQVLHLLVGADAKVCDMMSRNHDLAKRQAYDHMVHLGKSGQNRKTPKASREKRKLDASGVSCDCSGILFALAVKCLPLVVAFVFAVEMLFILLFYFQVVLLRL